MYSFLMFLLFQPSWRNLNNWSNWNDGSNLNTLKQFGPHVRVWQWRCWCFGSVTTKL